MLGSDLPPVKNPNESNKTSEQPKLNESQVTAGRDYTDLTHGSKSTFYSHLSTITQLFKDMLQIDSAAWLVDMKSSDSKLFQAQAKLKEISTRRDIQLKNPETGIIAKVHRFFSSKVKEAAEKKFDLLDMKITERQNLRTQHFPKQSLASLNNLLDELKFTQGKLALSNNQIVCQPSSTARLSDKQVGRSEGTRDLVLQFVKNLDQALTNGTPQEVELAKALCEKFFSDDQKWIGLVVKNNSNIQKEADKLKEKYNSLKGNAPLPDATQTTPTQQQGQPLTSLLPLEVQSANDIKPILKDKLNEMHQQGDWLSADQLIDKTLNDPEFRKDFISGIGMVVPADVLFKSLAEKKLTSDSAAEKERITDLAFDMIVQGAITPEDLKSDQNSWNFKSLVTSKDIYPRLNQIPADQEIIKNRTVVALQGVFKPQEVFNDAIKRYDDLTNNSKNNTINEKSKLINFLSHWISLDYQHAEIITGRDTHIIMRNQLEVLERVDKENRNLLAQIAQIPYPDSKENVQQRIGFTSSIQPKEENMPSLQVKLFSIVNTRNKDDRSKQIHELSKEFNLMESAGFKDIVPSEFYAKTEGPKAFVEMLIRQQRLSEFIQTTLLQSEDPKERARLIEVFIELAMECQRNGNFLTAQTITTSFQTFDNLSKTWDAVTPWHKSLRNLLKSRFITAEKQAPKFYANEAFIPRISENAKAVAEIHEMPSTSLKRLHMDYAGSNNDKIKSIDDAVADINNNYTPHYNIDKIRYFARLDHPRRRVQDRLSPKGKLHYDFVDSLSHSRDKNAIVASYTNARLYLRPTDPDAQAAFDNETNKLLANVKDSNKESETLNNMLYSIVKHKNQIE